MVVVVVMMMITMMIVWAARTHLRGSAVGHEEEHNLVVPTRAGHREGSLIGVQRDGRARNAPTPYVVCMGTGSRKWWYWVTQVSHLLLGPHLRGGQISKTQISIIRDRVALAAHHICVRAQNANARE